MSLNGSRCRQIAQRVAVLLCILAAPSHAHAHMTVKGMNHFSSGVLHPLMTPAHILIILALGLAIGQNLHLSFGATIGTFAASVTAGLAATAPGWFPGVHPAILAGIAFLIGGFVALEKRFSPLAFGALISAAGLAVALDSNPESSDLTTILMTLLGTWLCLLVFLMNVAHCASLATESKKHWLHIALRIAGSWILAISLLVLAFALRK